MTTKVERQPSHEKVDRRLLDKIDRLELSQRAARLREQYFHCKPAIAGERARLAMESWKETESEPIDVRCAKLLKGVLEGMPVVIFREQMLAGSETKYFRGANPTCDYDGSYLIPLLKEVQGQVSLGGPVERGVISQEDYATLREAINYWKGKTPADRVREAAAAAMGSWYDDLVEAGGAHGVGRAVSASFLNHEKLVNGGLGSIIAEAERRIQEWLEHKEDDVDKLYFWQGAIIALQAAITLARRYSKVARDMAAVEEDPQWRAELEEIAEVCQWVPENPARSFREALQSIVLFRLAVKMQTGNEVAAGLGLVDQYLYPYFTRDLDQGRLSLEKAADLVSDLFLFLNRQETVRDIVYRDTNQKGNSSNIGLGGPNRQGEDASNELTYLILHVRGLVKYIEPHLAIRWHKETPTWLMRKALQTNLHLGGGVPQFQNTEHIIRYFTERGIPLENARYWQPAGCSRALPWDWTAHLGSSQINVALYVDLALHDGKASKTGKQLGVHTGDPRQFATFDEFHNAFKKQCEYVTRRQLWHARLTHRVSSDMYRMPLKSVLMPGCLEKGRDCAVGGLSHYDCWVIKDRGIIPAADSLTATKRLVYKEKRVSMGELLEALDSNFEGERGEAIRQLCLAAPKYGNDLDEADLMVRDAAKFSADVVKSEKNTFGGPYVINRNGQAWHYMAGKKLAALPNGRRKAEPLADGSLSATQGMDGNGPTALLNSALKADFKEADASVLTVKFPAPLLRGIELRDKVAGLTESFFKRGGSYIQYNILDAESLREARRHPEKYRDLIVRVGGYSAYFVNLSPEVQEELIQRTEHSLAGV
ncbi:MAG: hypothetical protein HY673_10315 [Chloroflexi bacterium]|nr:hypothetical protein [Chloroflexota bacterium]